MTTKKTAVDPKELRKFGIAFFVFLSILSTVFIWKNEWHLSTATTIMLSIGGLFLLTAIVRPQLLSGIFHYWMKLAFALGWFNTRLILVLIYYLVIAPFSIVIKIFGGDLLKAKIKGDETTFWFERENKEMPPERYEKQF